jgi:hypothetical protein
MVGVKEECWGSDATRNFACASEDCTLGIEVGSALALTLALIEDGGVQA